MTGSGTLTGRIADPSGAGVANAQVVVRNDSGDQISSANTGSDGDYTLSSLPPGNLHLEVASPGFQTTTMLLASNGTPLQQDVTLQIGTEAQTVEVAAEAPPPPAMASRAASARNGAFSRVGPNVAVAGVVGGVGGGAGSGAYKQFTADQLVTPIAHAQPVGDLFEYKVKDPITILKNRSALAPILQANVEAEKVSLWRDGQTGSPARAIWLTNSSGLTLDGGALSVLDEDTFSGEGIFEPIRPNERRLISYATDLALTASSRDNSENGHVTRVRIDKGILTQFNEYREKHTYTFRNQDSKSRSILIEHPVRPDFHLSSKEKPVETTSDWMRFRMELDPKQTKEFIIEEARPSSYAIAIANITPDQVTYFSSQRSIDPTIEQALRDILTRKDRVNSLHSKVAGLDTNKQNIFNDQQRVRENVKALKGTPEEKPLLERYTRQLDSQENQLEAIAKQRLALETEIDAAQADLNAAIEHLAFDTTL